MPDHVDQILEQWRTERPDIDVSGMAVIGRLSRVQRLVAQQLDVVFNRHDLEAWEFDVLATLLRSGEPYQLTAGALLDTMMITSGAMTNRIDRLEAKDLVRRVKNPDDGRQVLVTLTDKGMGIVDAAVVDHAANELDILAGLNRSEQDQLVALLQKLHGSISR